MSLAVKLVISIVGLVTALVTLLAAVVDPPSSEPSYPTHTSSPEPGDAYCGGYDANCY